MAEALHGHRSNVSYCTALDMLCSEYDVKCVQPHGRKMSQWLRNDRRLCTGEAMQAPAEYYEHLSQCRPR